MKIIFTLAYILPVIFLNSCTNSFRENYFTQNEGKLLGLLKRHSLMDQKNLPHYSIIEEKTNSKLVNIHYFFNDGKYIVIESKVDKEGNFVNESIIAVINICEKPIERDCVIQAYTDKLKVLRDNKMKNKTVIFSTQ